MIYKNKWVDVADAELLEAVDWYNNRRNGLGIDLAECVDAAMETLNRHPFIGTPVSNSVRRILIRRFPYGIFYRIDEDLIEIVGFRHFRQRPLEL